MHFLLAALWVGAVASPEAPRLAGRLVLTPTASRCWGWAGAWLWPVGDPHALGEPSGGTPGFQLLRGLGPGEGAEGHQGADLGNGRGGDTVRAAAAGLVVYVGWQSGYGRHIVIAHRLPEGGFAYSVYAHLRPGSIRVKPGGRVQAGWRIARVGRSGRASTEHLHFEIRLARDAHDRWEKQPVADPVSFVASRLPTHHADSSWAGPYLTWAELAGLIPRDREPGETVRRETWWRLLAHAACGPLDYVPGDADSLRSILVRAGLLPEDVATGARESVTWSELARDLARLGKTGLRPGPATVARDSHRACCRRVLGVASPALRPGAIRSRDGEVPTLGEACLACADVALTTGGERAKTGSRGR